MDYESRTSRTPVLSRSSSAEATRQLLEEHRVCVENNNSVEKIKKIKFTKYIMLNQRESNRRKKFSMQSPVEQRARAIEPVNNVNFMLRFMLLEYEVKSL